MRPGRVIEVLDSGNIKASAPGLFAEEDKDSLPPIMPFFGNHANSYSEPMEGDEVWILDLSDNPEQLFWFRKDDRTEPNMGLEDEKNVEVICNREAQTGYAQIFYSDGTGWCIVNQDSWLQVRNDSIYINPNNDNCVVHINRQNISLGKEGQSKYHVARAEPTQDALNTILSLFQGIAAACVTAQTTPIKTAINAQINKLSSQIDPVKSDIVTVE